MSVETGARSGPTDNPLARDRALRDPVTRRAAERVLSYLAATDPIPATPAELIIGFGVFDRELPRFCGELFAQGLAPRILFTGGYGAGTGDLGGPEADIFRAELRAAYPHIPDDAIWLENTSTNTAEDLHCSAALVARRAPELAFGAGIRRAILVASPSRLRRVSLTLRHLFPAVTGIRQLPPVDFAREEALYLRNGVGFRAHLCGELDRIIAYPARGWIAAEPLPPEIAAAHAVLRSEA